MADKRRGEKQDHQRHLIGKLVMMAVLAVAFLAAGYAARLWTQTKTAVAKTYEVAKTKEGKTVTYHSAIDGTKPLSILLLGTDTGAFGRTETNGRTDAMILVTIDSKAQHTTMTSLPRDMLSVMADSGDMTGQFAKLNAAYAYGGASASIQTVHDYLNVPINKYVVVNMSGLAKIVDAVGGIDIDVKFGWTDKDVGNQTFVKGKQHVNGKRALAYARMRHEDPEGDNGRAKRQQEVIEAIVKKALSASSLSNYENVMASLSSTMRTDLSFDDLLAIAAKYRAAASNITKDAIKATGAWVTDGSGMQSAYQVATTAELQRVSDAIRKELGLASVPLTGKVIEENKLNAANGMPLGDGGNPIYTLYNVQ
ncbi:LCP family protein [Lacticaseibacillus mingshuiensis]|uniref:LCP family protein n=1 Tax=Lacticaseibacillus mingshuiensis TaxID=2799574 RepID=UPI0019457A6C|nr:LCP family protein [Lacticaseibacillus mingshuiensis]